MNRRKRIIYWVATGWLALGMFSTGVVQLVRQEDEVQLITNLGYPVYFIVLLGVWKLCGTIAILLPKFALLKEWAYAGFFFAMSGAIVSHVIAGSIQGIFPALLLLLLTVLSWYYRPENKKVHPLQSE